MVTNYLPYALNLILAHKRLAKHIFYQKQLPL